ncbi:hypothetical protein PINS_up021615 [Pythium insidiosum]|nr:hypothetical protein PINS_up021615 [Pythium insidiosum]
MPASFPLPSPQAVDLNELAKGFNATEVQEWLNSTEVAAAIDRSRREMENASKGAFGLFLLLGGWFVRSLELSVKLALYDSHAVLLGFERQRRAVDHHRRPPWRPGRGGDRGVRGSSLASQGTGNVLP